MHNPIQYLTGDTVVLSICPFICLSLSSTQFTHNPNGIFLIIYYHHYSVIVRLSNRTMQCRFMPKIYFQYGVNPTPVCVRDILIFGLSNGVISNDFG